MLANKSTKIHHSKHQSRIILNNCIICDSKAIGINFGVPTCCPCKAFFRRNARRKEILKIPCQTLDYDTLSTENNKYLNTCNYVRQCTPCRLRRCFDVGMKEELIRTVEQNQQFKQLIEKNRQQRQQLLKLQQNNILINPEIYISNNDLLNEIDWRLLTNIVYTYDNYCIKNFIENRKNIFNNEINYSDQSLLKMKHHQSIRINSITSFLSYILSIPIIQTLSSHDRSYLCKHNIRSLIFLNLHEIEQTCFTDISQLNADNIAAEYVYGSTLFNDSIEMKNKITSLLITDSTVTRLWLLILFLSSPLLCYYDYSLPKISHKSRLDINHIQQSFIILLWNYLLYRHGYFNSIRIFSNLICAYLRMQRVSQAVNHQIRTRTDLITMNQAFNQAVVPKNDR